MSNTNMIIYIPILYIKSHEQHVLSSTWWHCFLPVPSVIPRHFSLVDGVQSQRLKLPSVQLWKNRIISKIKEYILRAWVAPTSFQDGRRSIKQTNASHSLYLVTSSGVQHIYRIGDRKLRKPSLFACTSPKLIDSQLECDVVKRPKHALGQSLGISHAWVTCRVWTNQKFGLFWRWERTLTVAVWCTYLWCIFLCLLLGVAFNLRVSGHGLYFHV